MTPNILSVETPTGATVMFIENNAVITAEDEAMLQALYSRSNKSARDHHKKVLEVGSGRFMEQYYVRYGHKSIGDCGSTTVYIENISILAAKALQHNQLYNGQERSTRYIDFSETAFFNPLHEETWRKRGDALLEGWRNLYKGLYPKIQKHLFDTYPNDRKISKRTYENAIAARAFDICRGLLPAGAITGLSWHGELSVFGEYLPKLKAHPLSEVQHIAQALEGVLAQVFKNSFPVKNHAELTEYYTTIADEVYHHDASCPPFEAADRIVKSAFPSQIIKKRGYPLPDRYKENGSIEIRCQLDYGSYRDLARHRSVFQRLPLLTTELGIHPWYLGNIAKVGAIEEIRQMAEETERCIQEGTHEGVLKAYSAQYFIPMMYCVSCRITGNLHALGYITELRSSPKVHPTLARMMYYKMREVIAPYIAIPQKRNPLDFSFSRGEDTITEKS